MRISKLLAIASLLFTFSTVHADEPVVLNQRVVGPVIQYTAESLQTYDAGWPHVKFAEGTDVVLETKFVTSTRSFVDNNGSDLQAVNELLADAIQVAPTFEGTHELFQQFKAHGEVRSGTAGPELGLWSNV